jgi:hypothetical protein
MIYLNNKKVVCHSGGNFPGADLIPARGKVPPRRNDRRYACHSEGNFLCADLIPARGKVLPG